MPVWRALYKHSKVYRPDGTLYASARSIRTAALAAAKAEVAFVREFDRFPDQERVVIEIVGVTAAWSATLFELPEE